ncbi:MAG TPA: hypothetical protein VK929_13120 [Longimicrobiales bacterium]|nr:hypothetical protein [Longimicrobiales bacterium]
MGQRAMAMDVRRRMVAGLAGLGMMVAAGVTMGVYYAGTYPAAVPAPGWCAGSGLLGCEAAVLWKMGSVRGVPVGWGGVLLGATVLAWALIPSSRLARTTQVLLALNAVAVTVLFFVATLVLKTLCLACTAYGVFSVLALGALGVRGARGFDRYGHRRPALMHLAVLGLILVAGGAALGRYAHAARTADAAVSGMRATGHFYSLPQVPWPSEISPYRTFSAAADFEAAAIRAVVFSDPLCIDCRVLTEQLRQLAGEFTGHMNVAYQFFPLDGSCNDVVDKDKHPGSCDLAYMAAWDPDRFLLIHDEIHDNMDAARDRAWQLELARRHGLGAALTDAGTRDIVHRLIRTGTEYARTSDRYAHGIRSTPTMILNNRMIIGTMPTADLRAIFRALVDEHEHGGGGFMEQWLQPGCVISPDDGVPLPCGG